MEKNSTKRGLVTGKSYIVANAIIRAKEIEDRVLVDQRDVDNLEFLMLNRLNYLGVNAKFVDDIDADVFNGNILRVTDSEDKFYMLIPGVNYDEFINAYRENIAYSELTNVFKSLDKDENLLRSPSDVKYLKGKEAILKDFCSKESILPVKISRPKQYTKISEK